MGLSSFFKSLLSEGKSESEIKKQVEEAESKSQNKETNVTANSSTSNVSASASRNNVRTQQKVKSQENLQKIEEREILWEMNKKIDELLEIKELYEDMLDWMVEISKKEDVESTRDVSRETSKESKLSPRLRQVIEITQEKGELNASDLSEELDLSQNRCSELLNTLFKANHLSKKRVGRKVYYRVNSSNEDLKV